MSSPRWVDLKCQIVYFTTRLFEKRLKRFTYFFTLQTFQRFWSMSLLEFCLYTRKGSTPKRTVISPLCGGAYCLQALRGRGFKRGGLNKVKKSLAWLNFFHLPHTRRTTVFKIVVNGDLKQRRRLLNFYLSVFPFLVNITRAFLFRFAWTCVSMKI